MLKHICQIFTCFVAVLKIVIFELLDQELCVFVYDMFKLCFNPYQPERSNLGTIVPMVSGVNIFAIQSPILFLKTARYR